MLPYYGTVFKIQREHTLDDIHRYMDDIRQNGMNIIVVWPSVYWWEDRTKPGYPYNTGREVLRYAGQIGLNVIMETAGQLTALEYAPDFVMKDEYYPVRQDGTRENRSAGYGYLNYFHPEVASLVEKQLTEICTAYKDFPALYGYDIFNETMFESYDRYTLERFRSWLREKYRTIQRLNDVWDRAYYDFSQIEFTHWTWASVMPYVDLLEFQKDCIGIQLRAWRDIVRRADPRHPTIADNLYSMLAPENAGYRPTDEWVTDQSVDELGMSYYPKNCVPAFARHKRFEMLFGFHSASKDRRFWVSELQTHNQSTYRPRTTVSPQELRVWTWECYAAGCRGVIYWKWHPFIKGIQTTGRGLVDYRGRPTPRSEESRAIAGVLNRHQDLFAGVLPEQPRVAIVYDRLNLAFHKAFTHAYPQVPGTQYHNAIEGLYHCLFDASIPAVFVRPADIGAALFKTYPVLFITSQLVMSDEMAQAIKAYAQAGGTVIIDGKFGFIGPDSVMLDAIPGGRHLQPILGMDWRDLDSEGQHISLNWDGKCLELEGYYERQLLSIEEGCEAPEILGTFDDGYPAVMRRRFGQGVFVYLPTALWYGYFNAPGEATLSFLRVLADTYPMRTYTLQSDGIRVSVSRGDAGILVYAFNDASRQEEATLRLPAAADTAYVVRSLRGGEIQCVQSDAHGMLTFSLCVQGGDVSLYGVTPA